jgi:hypothetical protein
MALITVGELEDRYGAVDPNQAQAHIDDVSAEVVDYVTVLDTDADNPIDPASWTEATVPAAIKGVVARVVNRALTNPLARTGEQLGDHNWQAPMGASGGTLGPKDRRIIRRAVRRLGVSTVRLEGELPLDPDQDSWLDGAL